MAARTIYIDADSILRLLTHYSEGDLPLDATLRSAGVSKLLSRVIGLEVRSDQWRPQRVDDRGPNDMPRPLMIRYEGKKVMVWGDLKDPEPRWREGVEAPKL